VPFSAADQMAGWLATLIEDGADESTVSLVAGSEGGSVLFSTDAGDNDGINAQLLGEAFSFAYNYPTYVGCRFKMDTVTQQEMAVGLVISDATFLLSGTTDGLYFRNADGAATLSLVAERNSAETVIGCATMVDATYITAEYLFLDGVLHAYINGVEVATLSNGDPNFPDDEYLTPTLAVLTGTTVALDATIDWFRVLQIQAA